MSMQLVLTVPAILKATQIELHPNGITESSTGKRGRRPRSPVGSQGPASISWWDSHPCMVHLGCRLQKECICMRSILVNMHLGYLHGRYIRFGGSVVWEHIRCKLISPCKLWELQSGSSDQHPRGTRDRVILQSGLTFGLGNHTFANSPSHHLAPVPLDVDPIAQIVGNHTFTNPPSHHPVPLPLDVDPMTQIVVSIVCT